LASMKLVRLELRDGKVVGEEWLLTDRGERIRDVKQGPDGAIYVVTEAPDGEIMKLSRGSSSALREPRAPADDGRRTTSLSGASPSVRMRGSGWRPSPAAPRRWSTPTLPPPLDSRPRARQSVAIRSAGPVRSRCARRRAHPMHGAPVPDPARGT